MALSPNHPLLVAVEDLIDGLPARALQSSYDELSQRYRSGARALRLSADDVHAYLAARLPATLAATTRVLEEIRRLRPDFQPRSSLDLGAGPGTATWAAAEVFGTIERAVLVESSPEMARVATELQASSTAPAVRDARTEISDATAVPGGADLVIAGYLLGELGSAERAHLTERAWAATTGCLVLVESGTPAGYATVIAARDALIALGAHVLAPCPGDGACPLGRGDWCHFAERLPRSSVHRAVKRAARSFEDEKFSYLVVSREPGGAVSRVVRRPLRRSGYVRLALCGPDGVAEAEYSRRQGPLYAAAARAEWGDEAPGSPAP